MPKKNWEKIGAMIGFVAFVSGLLLSIYSLVGVDSASKYFAMNIVLFFAMFVYFEYFKEYPTSSSKRTSKTE